jgi:hypothetical protein
MNVHTITIICVSFIVVLIIIVIIIYKMRNSENTYQSIWLTSGNSRQKTSSKNYGPLGQSTMLSTTRSYKPPKFQPEFNFPPIPGSSESSTSNTPPKSNVVAHLLPIQLNIKKIYPVDIPSYQQPSP